MRKTMLAKIVIPKGFRRLKLGEQIRSGDWLIDFKDKDDGKIVWVEWIFNDLDHTRYYQVKESDYAVIRKIKK